MHLHSSRTAACCVCSGPFPVRAFEVWLPDLCAVWMYDSGAVWLHTSATGPVCETKTQVVGSGRARVIKLGLVMHSMLKNSENFGHMTVLFRI